MIRLSAFAVAALLAARASAQCTPVDCLSQLPAWGGLCAETFVDGVVGVPYSDAISFHITNACTEATLFDPDLVGVSIRITLVSSITFDQMPVGLAGTPNQPTYTPPANGCGTLSGTPTEAGVFDVTVNMVANVNAWPFSLACGGFGPIPQNDNPVSFAVQLTVRPDPSFVVPATPMCTTDAPYQLLATGTGGGTFSGPGVSGSAFDPASAGIGTHTVTYVVSAQEGAAVAAATDSLSLEIIVEDCTVTCDADAGTTNDPGSVICLTGGEATLIAAPNGDAVVPDGYVQSYVLTSGPGLVIIDADLAPAFTVTAIGEYRIHSLVIDPSTFMLTITPGVTTGFDVLDYFDTEGVCGDLDPIGTEFLVDLCDGMPDASGAGFGVYPNPSAGGFFIVPNSDGQALMELLDVSGRVAHQQRITGVKGAASWVEADVAPGSYILRVSRGQERHEQRVVIRP